MLLRRDKEYHPIGKANIILTDVRVNQYNPNILKRDVRL